MLSSDYYVKINLAARKISDPTYRNKTVRELMLDYECVAHNIIESSQILTDIARLMGMIENKFNTTWRFTDLRMIQLKPEIDKDEETVILAEDARRKIAALSNNLFPDFKTFSVYWSEQTFSSIEEFLKSFYRYVPHAKLGIDDEKMVSSLCADSNDLQLGFARQSEVIRRVKDVFLARAPDDLPDFIGESLRGFAIRMEDDAIPFSIKEKE